MVLYCQKCGSQLVANDSLFCSRCGTKICATSPPQIKGDDENQSLSISEVIDVFSDLILGAFNDLDKLDEITIIKYILKLIENDVKNETYSRKFRTNRIVLIQGILHQLGFDIGDNTIEYLYDSIISDMDLGKIPNHSIQNYKFGISVNKEEAGPAFFEFMCPVCDKNIRFEVSEEYLKDSHDWKLICPDCSYKAEISQSSLKRK